MSNKNNHLPAISEEENISRIIFDFFLNDAGLIIPNAFLYREIPPDDYVSMIREDYFEITEENLIKLVPCWKDLSLMGYASLKRSICRQIQNPDSEIEINIEEKPTRNNPAHAGLFYLKKGIIITRFNYVEEDILETASELADRSEYHPFQKQNRIFHIHP